MDMDIIKQNIRENYVNYCKKWHLTLPERLLLQHYTEHVIGKSIFKDDDLNG